MNRAIFFKHFELLADQPDAVAKMRELILNLALRGKLVPQNAKDEPAESLLERIRAARARLHNEGKVKTRVEIAPIGRGESPYPIPSSWVWIPLNEIMELVYGKLLPTSELLSEGFDVFGANGIIGKYSRYHYEDEMLLISCRGAYSGTPNISPRKCYVTNNSIVCEFFDPALCDIRFFHAVISISPREKIVTGTAQPQVTVANAIKLPAPLPPLAEQRRIVAKVDELMALCDELEQRQQARQHASSILQQSALHHLLAAREPVTFASAWQRVRDHFHLLHNTPEAIPQLRQAILQLAVQGRLVPQNPKDEPATVLAKSLCAAKAKLLNGRNVKEIAESSENDQSNLLFPLPLAWQSVKLGEIADIGSGSTPTSTNPDYYNQGTVPWITSSATSRPFIDAAEVLITKKAVADFRLKLYEPGTILIALYGQGKTRGQVSRLRIAATVNQACATITLPSGYEAVKDYVVLVLREQYLKIREQSAGGAQPNLNGGKIKSIIVGLPPLAEQKRIVARVEELLRWCDTLEAQLDQTRTLGAHLLASTLHHLLAA